MNIKSLLLGSAAAFAVVSGAQAADAVVAAEPEPMEYVKVCDAYGTGYFYIPGTETCLKIGGQFRFEKKFSHVDHSSNSRYNPGSPFDVSKYNSTYYDVHGRVKLDVTAKNDSEWGTVWSWVRIQGDQDNNASQKLTWYYTFGIGGLEFGNFDSPWARFFGFYAGFTDDGGYYTDDWNYSNRQYVAYTADFGAYKAFISLDSDNDEYYAGGANHNDQGIPAYPGPLWGDHKSTNPVRQGHKYMPDVSGGVTGTFGDWSVAGGFGYDESDKSVALKGLIAGEFGMFGVRFMPLWSNSNQNIYFNYDGFSGLIGLQAKVTDTITLSKDIQFWDDGSWRLVGDVNWQVASGFSVLLEGVYADPHNAPKTKSGFIRFQRDF